MKTRPGDALAMVERVFGPVMIVEWNGRKYLAPPPPPPVKEYGRE